MLAIIRQAKFLGPLLVLLIASTASYNLGVRLTEAEYERALLESRRTQDALVAELDAATQKIRERKAVDVRTIYVEKDPTGCADTTVPDGLFEAIVGDQPSTSKEL